MPASSPPHCPAQPGLQEPPAHLTCQAGQLSTQALPRTRGCPTTQHRWERWYKCGVRPGSAPPPGSAPRTLQPLSAWASRRAEPTGPLRHTPASPLATACLPVAVLGTQICVSVPGMTQPRDTSRGAKADLPPPSSWMPQALHPTDLRLQEGAQDPPVPGKDSGRRRAGQPGMAARSPGASW